MKALASALLLLFAIHFFGVARGQESYIKKATDACCDCFSEGGKINQDSVFTACAVKAVSANFFGLLGELTDKYSSDPNFDIQKEMIKHFIKCRSIRKYYYKKQRAQKKAERRSK